MLGFARPMLGAETITGFLFYFLSRGGGTGEASRGIGSGRALCCQFLGVSFPPGKWEVGVHLTVNTVLWSLLPWQQL